MGFVLDDKDNVGRDVVRPLIAFLWKCNACAFFEEDVSGLHAVLNVRFQAVFQPGRSKTHATSCLSCYLLRCSTRPLRSPTTQKHTSHCGSCPRSNTHTLDSASTATPRSKRHTLFPLSQHTLSVMLFLKTHAPHTLPLLLCTSRHCIVDDSKTHLLSIRA